mgnify:FL=1
MEASYEKNKVLIVITTLAIIILTIVAIVIIKSYNNSKINNIQLNTEVWISPLTKYTIDNTNDIFEVTNKILLPQQHSSETSSWEQTINYKFTCNGIDYTGDIIFNSDYGISYNEDDNPYYKVTSSNFKDNSVFIQILKK